MPAFPGQSGGEKQAEPLFQNGKGNENESLGQSGKSKTKETNLCMREETVTKATEKRHPERGKVGNAGLGHQAQSQRRRPRKVKSIKREDVAILHKKALQTAVVTHPIHRVGKAKIRNWQKLKGFMWRPMRTLTNMTFLLSWQNMQIDIAINSYLKKKLKSLFFTLLRYS